MKPFGLLCFSLLLFLVVTMLSYADQLEDAKAAIQNEDFTRSYELLLPLSEENDAEAQFLLGSLYINGQGVEKDDTKGLSWTMKSARQGYDQARSRALAIFLDLANQGDAGAMYNLGYMYLNGWGGEQDTDIGIGWLESAAEYGHVRSAKVLSGIYAEGKFGIPPDDDKASFWRNLPVESASGINGTWSRKALVQDGPLREHIFDSDARKYILGEIIVNGGSISGLPRTGMIRAEERMEMIKAEDLKFEIFNTLNSTDEFDITCEMYTPTGSIVPRRVCDAGYMKNAREEDARRFIDHLYYMDGVGVNPFTDDTGSLPRPEHRLSGDFAHKTDALKKEMVGLAIKHPSLAKAMINEYELKQRYIVERRERSKDSILIGRTEPEDYFGDELKWLNIAFVAYNVGMMEKGIWGYWDRRFRSVIHQEPYRSIWLSSNTETYAGEFVAYVNRILSRE